MSELIQDRAPSAGVAAPGAGPAPGSVPPPGGAATQAPGRRGPSRFLLFALAAIAGLVVGGVILFLRSSGADDMAAEPVTPAGGSASSSNVGAAAPTGEAEQGEGASAEGASTVPARTTRLSSRDPFAPLYAKKSEAAPGGSTSQAAPGASTSQAAPGASGDQAPQAPAAEAPAAPRPATGGTISALAISPLGNSVSLKLDGKKYDVDEGEKFAEDYRLYDIFNENCAGFLYGDQNAIVCEGDKVTIG